MSMVIVGSLAFDTIETPLDRRERIVGGSCTYAALAASLFTQPAIVAAVGQDFPEEMIALFREKGVDVEGIQVEAGKTFHWEGRYGTDPNQRTTIKTELNVFQNFKPRLLPAYRKADIVFLGNIDPDLQVDILNQVEKPRLVAMDSMNLWINTKPEALHDVMSRVDIFFANDEEVKMLAGKNNLITAGRMLLDKGLSLVVIKKGEHGAVLITKEFMFGIPAYPSEKVFDPTGAGDSFGGAFLGYLDKVGTFEESDIRKAAAIGTVAASFVIEDFGMEPFRSLSVEDLEERLSFFKKFVSF